MIIKAGERQFSVSSQKGIAPENFTDRYKLAELETKLDLQRAIFARMIESDIGDKARALQRQRERISRLEIKIDALKLIL